MASSDAIGAEMAIDGAVPQTPVKARDKHWATSEGRADWLEPHPAMVVMASAGTRCCSPRRLQCRGDRSQPNRLAGGARDGHGARPAGELALPSSPIDCCVHKFSFFAESTRSE